MNRSRTITQFHTPDALRELADRDFADACEGFPRNRNAHPLLRPYQVQANDALSQDQGEPP